MKKNYEKPYVEIYEFIKIETSDEQTTVSNVTDGSEGSVEFWK